MCELLVSGTVRPFVWLLYVPWAQLRRGAQRPHFYYYYYYYYYCAFALQGVWPGQPFLWVGHSLWWVLLQHGAWALPKPTATGRWECLVRVCLSAFGLSVYTWALGAAISVNWHCPFAAPDTVVFFNNVYPTQNDCYEEGRRQCYEEGRRQLLFSFLSGQEWWAKTSSILLLGNQDVIIIREQAMLLQASGKKKPNHVR